ncbi:MAG TPA: hypothetical protein VNE41_11835 [Chitinophagaceae bacterium]|nr:hypothetical protein [Chitinophagaceae bacterium]
MSLDNLKLDPFLLAGLYKQYLIPEERERTVTVPGGTIENSRGQNGKNILLIGAFPERGFPGSSQFSFLEKLLSACKLSVDEVSMVNTSRMAGMSLEEILGKYSPRICLIFGEVPGITGMGNELRKNIPMNTRRTVFLFTDSLDSLIEEAPLKKQLWPVLREVFQL